jgi:hypothetical protein
MKLIVDEKCYLVNGIIKIKNSWRIERNKYFYGRQETKVGAVYVYGGNCFVVMINGHTCEYRWVRYLSLWNGDNTSRWKQQESTALHFI